MTVSVGKGLKISFLILVVNMQICRKLILRMNQVKYRREKDQT